MMAMQTCMDAEKTKQTLLISDPRGAWGAIAASADHAATASKASCSTRSGRTRVSRIGLSHSQRPAACADLFYCAFLCSPDRRSCWAPLNEPHDTQAHPPGAPATPLFVVVRLILDSQGCGPRRGLARRLTPLRSTATTRLSTDVPVSMHTGPTALRNQATTQC